MSVSPFLTPHPSLNPATEVSSPLSFVIMLLLVDIFVIFRLT